MSTGDASTSRTAGAAPVLVMVALVSVTARAQEAQEPPEVQEVQDVQEAHEAQEAQSATGKAEVEPPGNEVQRILSPEHPEEAVEEARAERHTQLPEGAEWLVDDQGRQFIVDKLPKSGGMYVRLGEGKVRTPWGVRIDYVDQDDEWIYFKNYRTDHVGAQARDAPPSEEELAAVAASYASEVESVDRLSFEAFDDGLPRRGQWRHRFDLADVDGDGDLDVVHGPPRKGRGLPVILLNQGGGSWRFWQEAKYPPLAYDYGAATSADFNGDGHQDIALGVHLRGLLVLIGDGKGGFASWGQGLDFTSPGEPGTGSGFSTRAITTADWNGDGRPDILALGEGPQLQRSPGAQRADQSQGVVLYFNQGDGTWLRHDRGTAFGEVFGEDLAVADLDRDGRPDLVTATSYQGRRDLVYLNRAGEELWERVDLELVRPGAYVHALLADDFDGDGHADLAIGYMSYELDRWRTGVDILYGRADAEWERRVLMAEENRRDLRSLASGDLDQDGAPDLAALTGDGEMLLFLGDGEGFFRREEEQLTVAEPGCRGWHVQLADLDGSPGDEIVASFAGEPTGFFASARFEGCEGRGSLRAWKPVLREDVASRPETP